MRLQPTEGIAEIAVIPGALCRTHIGVVTILVSPIALTLRRITCLRDSKSCDRRANGDGEEQQNGRRAENGDGRFAPAPSPKPFDTTDRTRLNSFPVEETDEFIGQFLSAWVAARRFLLQALEANRVEVGRHARIEQPR